MGARRTWLIMAIAAMGAARGAEPEAGAAWRSIAEADARAALELVAANHPGAVPALGDTAFLERLRVARRHVDERLPLVRSYGGYNALMNGVAADFRDGHIWAGSLVAFNVRKWAGILPVRRGGRWVVGLQEAQAGEPDLKDAEIVSCGGEAFDHWARERIGQFGGNPHLEAELARRAPVLLLDDDNPFLAVPRSCTFRGADGASKELPLAWRQILQSGLVERAGRALRPAIAGMAVTPFAGGYWIGLGNLGSGAAEVVAAVRRGQQDLLAAPMVVLDLRGNGGGDSAYARQIAELLAGPEAMRAISVAPEDCAGAYWRASPFVLETVDTLAASGDPERARRFGALADQIRQALAAGQPFAPALPACAAQVAPRATATAAPPLLMRGRLVLVTDQRCFSSCLIAADIFRKLGALHVGEQTDMSTRYMEVREIPLPSGLRTFSTLQKVALGLGALGPYTPQRPYPGVLADDAALKAWVAALPPEAFRY